MHRASADADLPSYFENALPGPQLSLDSFFTFKPRMDSLADHAAFKLGKGAGNLKHDWAKVPACQSIDTTTPAGKLMAFRGEVFCIAWCLRPAGAYSRPEATR
jgi:hypothetical protein